jgi:hypothetical protein
MDVHDLVNLQLMEIAPVHRRGKRADLMQKFTASEFRQRFRLRQEVVINLSELLKEPLHRAPCSRNYYLTVLDQLLVILRFLATGSFQEMCADTVNVFQVTVSRCISRVIQGIVSLRQQFISFPLPGRSECSEVKVSWNRSIPRSDQTGGWNTSSHLETVASC